MSIDQSVCLDGVVGIRRAVSGVAGCTSCVCEGVCSYCVMSSFVRLSLRGADSSSLRVGDGIRLRTSVLRVISIFCRLCKRSRSCGGVAVGATINSPKFVRILLGYTMSAAISILFVIGAVLKGLGSSSNDAGGKVVKLVSRVGGLYGSRVSEGGGVTRAGIVRRGVRLSGRLGRTRVSGVGTRAEGVGTRTSTLRRDLVPSGRGVRGTIRSLRGADGGLGSVASGGDVRYRGGVSLTDWLLGRS